MCLLSYTVKTKSKGAKNVLILSTMRPIHGVTKDDAKKPALYKFGETDIVDQMNDFYSCSLFDGIYTIYWTRFV